MRGKGGGRPWEKLRGSQFKGQRLPFGCLVDFMPSAARKESVHKFSNPTEPGIMVGYFLQPGGCWSGDFPVLRVSDLNVPLSDFSMSIPTRRAREVFHVLDKPFVSPESPA